MPNVRSIYTTHRTSTSFTRSRMSRVLAIVAFMAAAFGNVLQTASAQDAREISAIANLGRKLQQAEFRNHDPINVAIDRSDVHTLLQLYRKADNALTRNRAAAGLFKVGGPATGRLLRLIATEHKSQLRTYHKLYQKQVAAAVKERRQGKTDADLETLQKQVTDLRKDPDLSKDQIVKDGDPAMASLEEILTMDRETVLASSQQLIAARNNLLEIIKTGHRAANHLPDQDKHLADKVPSLTEAEAQLIKNEDLLAFLATPISDEAMDVLEENEELGKALTAEEIESISILNQMRIRVGMQPLKIDLKLCEAGKDHSTDMATLNFFSHTSPVSGKKTPWDRAKNFGTKANGENIAAGYPSPFAVIKGWWYSPGHHKNMMNPKFSHIGIGKYNRHWTQMFAN